MFDSNPTTTSACWNRAEALYRRAAQSPHRAAFYHRRASQWIAEAVRIQAPRRPPATGTAD